MVNWAQLPHISIPIWNIRIFPNMILERPGFFYKATIIHFEP